MIAGAPRPDVYIAALGPQLLKIAGRRTAGTCTWMTGPKTLAGHVSPTLRQAAADAGRPEDAVRVVAALPVSVTDDVDGARKQAAEQFAMYGVLPSYRAMLDREGYAGPEDAAIIGDEATVRDRLAELQRGRRRRVRRCHIRFVARGAGPHPRGAARTRRLIRLPRPVPPRAGDGLDAGGVYRPRQPRQRRGEHLGRQRPVVATGRRHHRARDALALPSPHSVLAACV